MNILRFNGNIGDYPEVHGRPQTAHISLRYKNRECVTSVLPTDVPITNLTHLVPITVRLDTQGTLGSCWNIDVSSGAEKMVMKLKLPHNSPIAVSKVQVIDNNNNARCWTSNWRNHDSNFNQQTNQWVTGKAHFETRFPQIPALANNFDDDCIQ